MIESTTKLDPKASQAKQTISCVFTMLTQMLGASILAVSFVTSKLGWVFAIILLSQTFIVALFTMYYFMDGCYYTKAKSFKDLTVKLIGKKAGSLLDISLYVSYYSGMVTYIIISARAIIGFASHIGFTLNQYVVKLVIVYCIMFPLCLLKSLDQLGKIATVAGLIIFVFIGTVVYYFAASMPSKQLCAFEGGKITSGLAMWPEATGPMSVVYLLMYIPPIFGNFATHPVIPRFLKELNGSYKQRRRTVWRSIVIALVLVFICNLAIGLMGAHMFGSSINQNILKAWIPCKDRYVDVLSLVYAFVAIVNFPLVLYPLKTSLIQTFGEQIETKRGYRMSVWINLAFLTAACLLALFLEAIISILGLFESLSGFLFYFMVPFYSYMVHKKLKAANAGIDLDKAAIIQMMNTRAEKAGDDEALHGDEPHLDGSTWDTETTTNSMAMSQNQMLPSSTAIEKNAIQLDEPEAVIPQKMMRNVKKSTKYIGWSFIAVYACTCVIGTIMNFSDILEEFGK